MRFEEALQAMREGKRVKFKNPHNDWYNVYYLADGLIGNKVIAQDEYSRMNTDSKVPILQRVEVSTRELSVDKIMSENWEIVEDEPQS